MSGMTGPTSQWFGHDHGPKAVYLRSPPGGEYQEGVAWAAAWLTDSDVPVERDLVDVHVEVTAPHHASFLTQGDVKLCDVLGLGVELAADVELQKLQVKVFCHQGIRNCQYG